MVYVKLSHEYDAKDDVVKTLSYLMKALPVYEQIGSIDMDTAIFINSKIGELYLLRLNNP
jgi:hypothetical protein